MKDKIGIFEKNEAFTVELKQAKSRLTNLEKCDKEKDDNLIMLERQIELRYMIHKGILR